MNIITQFVLGIGIVLFENEVHFLICQKDMILNFASRMVFLSSIQLPRFFSIEKPLSKIEIRDDTNIGRIRQQYEQNIM